jgi:hypothetical protein
MHLPPTSLLLLNHQPPATRPVYDIPPVIKPSPRWPRLKALAARIGRTPPTPSDTPWSAARLPRDIDHVFEHTPEFGIGQAECDAAVRGKVARRG